MNEKQLEKAENSGDLLEEKKNPYIPKLRLRHLVIFNSIVFAVLMLIFVGYNWHLQFASNVSEFLASLDFFIRPMTLTVVGSTAFLGFQNFEYSRRKLQEDWDQRKKDIEDADNRKRDIENEERFEKTIEILDNLITLFEGIQMKLVDVGIRMSINHALNTDPHEAARVQTSRDMFRTLTSRSIKLREEAKRKYVFLQDNYPRRKEEYSHYFDYFEIGALDLDDRP